jgi:hypothetical protein
MARAPERALRATSRRRRRAGAPRRAHTAHHPYAVTTWTTRRLTWPGPRPRARAPVRARCRRLGRAVRTPSRWTHVAPNVPGPSRPSHLACMRAIRPARRPTHSSRLAFARAQLRAAPPRPTSPPVGARRCTHCPPPLLEYKRHSSLHPNPLDPPVHVHWPAEPPARRHCDRRSRPPLLAADRRPSRSPPNRPRQSTEGESKPHPSRLLTGVRPSLAVGRSCAAAGDLLARIEIFPGA